MSAIVDDVRSNEGAYERLRPQLEATHKGHWVVFIQGQLVASGLTREEALRRAGHVPPGVPSRLVRKVGEELPKVVRKL
ncbi:MAG: hypothetical protein HY721_27470 [Planctomycetes bacterium]|nr:hypothetical protein [Planctomycetota bacterium]